MKKKPVSVPAPEKVRSVQEIQQEYNQTSFQLGSFIHRHERAPFEIEKLKRKLVDLDMEGEAAILRERADAERKERDEAEKKAAEALKNKKLN